jgi:hypothetical protein
VERALAYGPLAAIEDRPRPGKEPIITPEAKAWLVSLACDKAKEHGYPHELWTTRLLARHAREHGPGAGHECLARLVQGTVCKILGQEEIKPADRLAVGAVPFSGPRARRMSRPPMDSLTKIRASRSCRTGAGGGLSATALPACHARQAPSDRLWRPISVDRVGHKNASAKQS